MPVRALWCSQYNCSGLPAGGVQRVGFVQSAGEKSLLACSIKSRISAKAQMDSEMAEEDSEEVEIDLSDSNESPELEKEEETQTLWKAQPSVEEEENIHTSTLVEISDTKPLIKTRDPRGINDCLKVTFEDVIAEPVSVRSGDRVWIWSNALFEVSRVWLYRILTVVLAIPMSVLSGVLFAIFSCFHVWMVGPCVEYVLIGTRWLQSLWNVVLGVFVLPFSRTAKRCCGGFSIHLAEE
uniref:Caveolin n=2 Tax=Oryzias latipes TaxID=8090 RepID=A0A3B3IEE7_ORYLA